MKTQLKRGSRTLLLAALAAVWAAYPVAGHAFHGGGVAHCDGCHSMHNSQDGAVNSAGSSIADVGNGFLTVGSDPSSTCLTCHNGGEGGYHVNSTDGSNYQPGGDFFWLGKTYTASHYESTADSHGHNTISADYGITQDAILTTGPSNGSVNYPASLLQCNSCHDPHGKIANNANPAPIAGSGSYGETYTEGIPGNYRLLGGKGYDGGQQASELGVTFASAAPLAKAPGLFAGAETDTNHVAYGSGMSEWCANCHNGFTAVSSLQHRHPAGNDAHLTNSFGFHYDTYVATGKKLYSPATSYDRLVPFEHGTVTYETTANLVTTSTGGVNSNGVANVTCLTCHRAHATPFSDIGRWDFQQDLLAKSPQLASANPEAVHVYYGEDITARYNEFQRSLCNKCHGQD